MTEDLPKSYLFPKEKAETILREAMGLAKSVRADKLDCSVSFARMPTEKRPEEVLKIGLADPKTLYHFIYRPKLFKFEDAYYDVGLSTLAHEKPDYFLWIVLSIGNGKKLIEKYKLDAF